MVAPRSSPGSPDQAPALTAEPGPFRFSAARVAGAYLIAGLLWVGLSDLAMAEAGRFADSGLLIAVGKGTAFVLLSAGLVYFLIRREFRSAAQATTLLRAVVEGTTDAVYVKDCDGRHLLVNGAAARFLGRPVPEVIGRNAHELFEAPDAERLIASDRAIMAGGRVVTLEETLTAAGVGRTYHATKAPYLDANGNVIGLVGISRDISEGKRVELALRESEVRFRTMADTAPVLMWLADTTGGCVWFNRRWLDFVGRSLEQEVGAGWVDGVHPDDRAECLRAYQSALDARVPFTMDYRLRRHDGEYRWVIDTGAPRLIGGEFAGYIGSCTDITDRKRAEDALRESEARYRELADAIPQIVWAAGPDGAITHVNAKGVEYTGLRADELAGWSWGRVIHPDDLAHATAEWARTIEDGVPRPVEMRIRRADGESRWHLCRQTPIRDAAGRIASWVGTNTDIEDLKRAEQALRETDSRLREAQRIARLGSWSWDPPTNKVRWSDAEFELFGVDQQVVTPSFATFLALVHPDDRAVAISRVEAMQAGANEFANDLRIIRPDGGCIWVHSRARATRDATGALVRVEGIDQDITVQKQAEAAARESEQRLQAAVEVAGLGVVAIDYDRQTADLSPRAAEQFGIASGAPVARSELHARFHPDDRAELERLTALALDPTGTGWFSLEHRVVRPDGTIRWLNVRKQVSFVNGRPHSAVVVTADVTDRRQTEDVLRDRERLLELVTSASRVGLVVVGEGYKYRFANDAYAEIFGLGSGDIVGRRVPEVLSGGWEQIKPRLDRAFAGERISYELVLPACPDGTASRHYRVMYEPRPDVLNRPTVVVVVVDVSDVKRTEAELRASEERYRLMFESNPHPMWVYDVDTFRFLAVNDAAVLAYGYTRDEFLSMTIRDIRPVEEVPRLEAVVARRTSGVAQSSPWKHRLKNGTLIDVEVSSHDIRDIDRSRLVLALNVTERLRAERELRESELRLRLALEAAGAIAFVWDVQSDSVTRYFSTEPALPVTAERIGTLAEVRNRIHPADLPGFDARLSASLESGTEYRNEYRVVRPDGSIACLAEYGYVDRAADGSPMRLTGMSIDITDRVAASEALRASEERLQEAARVAGFGVFEHDLLTDSLFWSPRLRDIYGVALDAPASLDGYLSMIHPDDRELVGVAVRKTHDPAGDGRFEVEHRLVRPVDGRVRWLASQAQTWFSGEGADRRPIRTVGATLDVTEAHEVAEALRASEERYRLLVNTLPTSVLIIDGGRLTFCNPACVSLFGAASESELLGRTSIDLVHPGPQGPGTERIEVIAAIRERSQFVAARIVRIDGQVRTVHAVAIPISQGRHSDAHLVCLTDITEQERSTALLGSVLGSVGDAILTIDARGTITSINTATERLCGYTEAELVGGNVNVLMPEPHHADHDRYIADYLRTGVARVIGVGREVDCRRKDGTTFPAELTVTDFLRDGERQFTGVLRDISARRRLEEQFRQSQKMEAVGRLAGGVAHDFNNLLTVINGYADLLLAGFPVGDPVREPLAAIQDAGERAARLTQQLLAFSRKSVVEPRLVDLNELVAESTKLLRRLIGEDISLAVLSESTPVRVVIDPGQLEQVLMNLAVNARDAMPTGGRLTIETRTVELRDGANRTYPDLSPGRYASLRVADTGCGMSAEVREKIFEPFFTTKGVGKGTGLGLSVVHGVVKQAGGSVGVESEVGRGTTFTVLLPAAIVPTTGDTSGLVRVAPRGTETILVVEDEDAVRTLVRVALEGQGYIVLPAAGGEEALALLQSQPGRVDILVTDVIMPRMSGRELAELARKAQPGLPVLYMSGYTDDALDRHGLDGAGDRFIQKPFTPLGLARKIRAILDRSE